MKSVVKFFCLSLVSGAAASAADIWLQPERFAATPGATLALELTSADGFNGPDTALNPERVATVRSRLAGEAVALAAPVAGEKALRFSATLPRPGVAVLGVELKPRERELEAEKIERYFRELHADDALRAVWAAVPEPRRWREHQVNTAKSFVRVGEPAADDRAWAEPLGFRLELVPERDPTALRAGDELPVRVLRGGAPLAGFTLTFVSAGETREHVTVTDDDGRARAALEVPGAWLVRGVELRRAVARELEWESDGTAMVVEVK